jgi:nucleoside-diphosphate-sugar epimerase
MSNKVKVLILGGAGYIGDALTDLFIEKKSRYDFTVFDNLIFEDHYLKPVKFVHGDINSDKNRIKDLIFDHDVVVNLAALVGDGMCQLNAELTTKSNLEFVEWLAQNCSKPIIHISSCSVYGEGEEVLNEDSEKKPLSLYAQTKLESEKYILDKNGCVLRLGTVFGVAGNFSRIRLDLVANILAARGAVGEVMKVYGGPQYRPIVHVKDVARCIEFCIDKKLKGVYNVHHRNYKISEIAEEIADLIGGKIEYKNIKFEDRRNYKVSSEKIRQFGFETVYDLKVGILEISELFRNKRVRSMNKPLYSNEAYFRDFLNNSGN